MNKITFINGQAPALNANNLNLLQTNTENAISNAKDEAIATSTSLINNATLTIQRNGVTVASFGANSSSNVTANISVPTNNNELANGAGYQTSANVQTAINNKIKYGTSLPSSADDGTIFLLYS